MDKVKKKLYPRYFAIPAIGIFGVFFLIPLLASFVLAFTDWNIKRVLTPEFNGLDNFKFLLANQNFLLAFKNTIIFAVMTTVFIIVIGFMLAIALDSKVFGKKIIRTIFYLPAVISLVVVGIIFSSLLGMDGIVNTVLRNIGLGSLATDWLGNPRTALGTTIVAQIWKWSGFTMAIFLAGLQGIGKEYYEAAKIDGANFLQTIHFITVPLLAPAFTIAITMNAIGGLKVFEQVYVMTNGGPGFASQVLGTFIYRSFSEGTLGRSTAMGLLQFITVGIFSVILNSYLRRRELEV